MNPAFPRRTFAVFLAMAVLVLAIGAISFATTLSFERASSRVNRSHRLSAQIDRVLSDVQNAETGQRGFLITGQESYLTPYTEAAGRLPADLADLRSGLAGDSEQIQRFNQLQAEVTAKLGELRSTLQVAQTAGASAARQSVLNNRGERYMQEIRGTIDSMRNAEQERFDEASNARDAAARNQIIALGSLLAVEVVLLGVLALFIRRYVGERRKRADQAVELAEAHYRAIGDAIPFGVWAADGTGRLTYVSESFLSFIGLTFEEFRDGGWERILPAEVAAKMAAEWERCRAESLPFDYLEEVRGADGVVRTVLGRGVPIPSSGGRMQAGYAGINLDVTERAEIEQALRQSEDRYRTLAEALPAMVASSAPDGQARYHNSRWSEYTGLSGAELAGDGWRAAVHPDDLPAILAAFEAARANGSAFEFDYRIRNRSGEYRWHHDQTIPVFDDDGGLAMWLSIEMDIESQKQTEEGLREAAAAKDEFLGLVSHELRTPLTIIVGNARALRRIAALSPEEQSTSIADIQAEAERLQRLIENMLTLSRIESQAQVAPEPVLLQRALPGIVSRQVVSRPIQVDIPDDLAPVAADPLYIEQVVRNLISNAAKYSPAGSAIDVRARNEGQLVSVSVLDRGAGVAPDEMTRIFEPFFRSRKTSAQAAGAGLGLSVCKRLIEALGGHMWARMRAGGGTEVGFSLPAYTDTDEPEPTLRGNGSAA